MIASAIAGIAQGAMGIGQMIGGLFMPKPKIPDYEIPQELFENMTDAEYWSFMGLPEAQKQQFIDNTTRTGLQALSQARDRKAGLGMTSSIAQQQSDDWKSMLAMDAQARMANIQTFWDKRSQVAQARDVKFGHDMNKVMYQRERRDQMLGAGMQNLAGSFSNLIGTDFGTGQGNSSVPRIDTTNTFAKTMTAAHNNVPTSSYLMSQQPGLGKMFTSLPSGSL